MLLRKCIICTVDIIGTPFFCYDFVEGRFIKGKLICAC